MAAQRSALQRRKQNKTYFLLTSSLLLFMVCITFLQVIFRYLLKSPLSWPEEIARWCLVWITFFGSVYGFDNGALVKIDYFVKKFFPKHMEKIMKCNWILIIFFYIMLAYSAFVYMLSGIVRHQLTPVTRVPACIPQLSIFTGSLLVVYYFIVIKKLRE